MKQKELTIHEKLVECTTKCKKGGNITPACQIIRKPDSCTIGKIDEARCLTCNEIIHQKIIR